ncbi:hypothetical protein QBC46DRAFT_387791 [Diplogelasinospora grovesii]|uniref:Secreted protein n=1 Tax=Diplogelasinospora grovesii TaxID=303347 RepID=A0AAN6N725_9PEZI|nr:hypothetical protein QBC46DRAFT_387791 [Diplogelasinospora grovesii]
MTFYSLLFFSECLSATWVMSYTSVVGRQRCFFRSRYHVALSFSFLCHGLQSSWPASSASASTHLCTPCSTDTVLLGLGQ